MKKFKIFTRYNYWSINEDCKPDKKWTKWFQVIPMDCFNSEAEAKDELKKIMAEEKDLAKKSKCKHEYEIREIELEEAQTKKKNAEKKKIESKEK